MRTRLLIALLPVLLPPAVAAQQVEVIPALPDSVAEHVLGIYNRAGTVRLTGETHIAAGTALLGDVAVLNGPLRIDGRVDGRVVLINGDIVLGALAHVTGEVIATGGSIQLEPGARADAALTAYREPLRFRYQDGGLVFVPPDLERGLSAGRDWPFGRGDVLIATRGAYNRVEGLPIGFGPRLRLGGSNPTRIHAFAVYRTTAGLTLNPDEFGYDAGIDQQLGVPGLSARLGLFSQIDEIESWQISDRESSLATFLLHRDYRDHYERVGWDFGVRMARPDLPYSVALTFRDERHESVRPRSPWSLLDNDEPWRPQPIVAEGTLRTLMLELGYDTRNEPADPSWGWLVNASLEQGVGGSLQLPIAAPGAASARTGFTTASLDLRRYARLSPYARLAVRALAAGSVDGSALPPQRQHALGGEGSLPAFPLLRFDCAARAAPLAVPGDSVYPHYGCDRMALVQLEYQASFPFALRLGDVIGLRSGFTNAVRWSAFFNAGRAWTEADARDGRGGGSADFSADVGLGIRIGALGIYWAVPLSGGADGINFFVRIGPRL
ncbi:MAG TPA: BamA/TamA family outer membrane protein [Longimicrobiales bacterium]|nr:BamA/TamA family outer membrane protein [Longimicrobiales bacterium]